MQKVYNEIIQIAGDVIIVEAEDIGYKELAEVQTSMGSSLAQVIRLEGKKVSLQVLPAVGASRLTIKYGF